MSDSYRFAALGPFVVPLKKYRKYRLIDFSAVGKVFEEAEVESKKRLGIPGVTEAIGCYILALKPVGGQVIWPYYVGQTCGQTLGKRVFQKQDKVAKYGEIMKEYKKATAYIYLIPLIAPSGKRFARKGTNSNRIDKAEQALISMALRVNYFLWNIQHRNESFTIDGTPLSGRRDTKAALSMRRMLGFVDYIRPERKQMGDVQPQSQDAGELEDPVVIDAENADSPELVYNMDDSRSDQEVVAEVRNLEGDSDM
jgi:hypothetical protein